MRKLSLLITILLLFGINNGFSAWYGDFTQTIGGGATWCNTDGNTTGGSPTFSKTPIAGTYTYDSKAIPGGGGVLHCQRWDGAAPSGLSISYISGWTNVNRLVAVYAQDLGGSKLKKIVLQQSTNGGVFNNVQIWDNLNGVGLVIKEFNRTVVNGNNYKYKMIAYDYAGNSATTTTNSLIQFDTTSPSLGDVINNTPTNLLAYSAYNYNFNISSNGGSPIVSFIGKSENSFNELTTTPRTTSTFSWNMKEVDNSRLANGSREYTFTLTKFCDQAGNCWNGSQPYKYNVYANTNNINTVLDKGGLDSLQIADGTIHPLNITLIDIHGNKIIPATGINRTIDFGFNVNNNLKLDQYNRTGDAVYLTTPNDPAYTNKLTSTTTFTSQTSTNGQYPFNFKVYTPTYNVLATDGRQYAEGDFTINNISYQIKDDIQTVNPILLNSNIIFNFKPLYKTKFSGPIKEFGFIEGATQTGVINIARNGTTSNTLNNKINLEFGSGAGLTSPSFDMYIGGGLKVGEGRGNNTLFKDIPTLGKYSLTTLITQTGALANIYNSYLATQISYDIFINGIRKNIVYNSDILGKANYNLTNTTPIAAQVGLKVLGKTLSDKQTDITLGQQNSNTNIVGNITKSSLKRDIARNAYNFVKNVPLNNGLNEITDLSTNKWNNTYGRKLQNDSILYFGDLAGINVVLDTSGNGLINPSQLVGKKTIVVTGGNLYIKSNIINNSASDVLGIIVLKDSTGSGGNVYIDPAVTRMDAIIYAEKSVISYNGVELDGDTFQSVLRNQLYIRGSLFSNNTIGGSRANPVVCPAYITGTCNTVIAQKYDLNYLRRYFIYTDPDPLIGDIPANGGTSAFLPSDPNYPYPVVIEYNPSVQISPPPLFYK